MPSMTPAAKSLILDLLLATKGAPLAARDAVTAGALFDISENSTRVALVRLSSAGLIEAAGRGTYRLGPSAAQLAADVATWRSAEQRVRAWPGGYVVVHGGAKPSTDRTARRRRERALAMLGFRGLDRGLFVRPDNLKGGVDDVRRRLQTLSLEEEAAVFLASGFDAAREKRARELWDGKALSASYRRTREQLERWLERGAGLEADVAAREAFLLGKRAIRQIVFDPLLPEPLVDTAARRAFVETTRRFDKAGRAIWRRFFGASAEG